MASSPDLEPTLARLLDQGRSAWPDLDIPEESFLHHLAAQLPPEGDPLLALADIHAADLYLALGCAGGQPAALHALDQLFFPRLTGYLVRRDVARDAVEEVKQALRIRLLVRENAEPPRIATYSGQGPLLAWLCIAASRVAADLHRSGRRHVHHPGHDGAASPAAIVDPEIAYLKTRYGHDLEAAFESALGGLSRRERTVLRLHYLEGMNIQAIASFLDTSKRTVERWVAHIRRQVLEETERLLAERLDLQPSQLDSLLRLVQSQIDPRVHRLL